MNVLQQQRQFTTASYSNRPFNPEKPKPKTAKVYINSTDKMSGTNNEATFKINLPTEFTTQNLGLTLNNFIPVYPTNTDQGIVQVNLVGVNNPYSYSSSNQTTHRSIGMLELLGEGTPKIYPPTTLGSSLSSNLNGLLYGNGTYTISNSISWNGSYPTWNIFDNNSNTYAANSTYNYTTGLPSNVSSDCITTATNSTSYTGYFIDLTLPNSIMLNSYIVQATNDLAKSATQWTLLGSINGGATWDWLHSQAYSNIVAFQVTNNTVSTSNMYNRYRLVLERAGNSSFSSFRDFAMVSEWRLIGYSNPQTGIITTTSSNLNTSALNAFDYNSNTAFNTGSIYDASSGVYQGYNFTTVDGSNMVGEWIELQTPDQIILNNYTLLADGNSNAVPNTFTLAVSSNGTNYTRVHTQSNINNWSAPWSFTFSNSNIPTSNAYNRFRILTHTVGNGGSTGRSNVGIAEMRLEGYSNAPYTIPPSAMTTNSSNMSGLAIGNGSYTCTDFNAFDYNTNTSAELFGYNSSGFYTGSTTTSVDGSNMSGDFVEIKAPSPVFLTRSYIRIDPNYNFSVTPRTFSIVAGSNAFNFTRIMTFCNITDWSSIPNYSQSNIQNVGTRYDRYRVIVHTANTTTLPRIGEFRVAGNGSLLQSAPPSNMTNTTITFSNLSVGNGTYTTTSSSNTITTTTTTLSRTGQSNLNAEIITTDRSLFNRPITFRLSSPNGIDLSTMCNWSAELTITERP